MKRFILSAALIALASAASAQEAEKVITPEALAWRPHPVFKEAQTAILLGDPTKAEVIVQRVKFPPNYKVPPHTHPYAEVVTVLSGNFGNAMGDKFDTTKGQMLKAGPVFSLP